MAFDYDKILSGGVIAAIITAVAGIGKKVIDYYNIRNKNKFSSKLVDKADMKEALETVTRNTDVTRAFVFKCNNSGAVYEHGTKVFVTPIVHDIIARKPDKSEGLIGMEIDLEYKELLSKVAKYGSLTTKVDSMDAGILKMILIDEEVRCVKFKMIGENKHSMYFASFASHNIEELGNREVLSIELASNKIKQILRKSNNIY